MSQAYNALLELPLPDGDDDEDADFAREDALFVVKEMLTVAKVRSSLPGLPPRYLLLTLTSLLLDPRLHR